MRQGLGLSQQEAAARAGVMPNLLSRAERGRNRRANEPWVLGRILPLYKAMSSEAFPEAKGDAYDFIIPPNTFGAWLKNFRMRRRLQLHQLAKTLGVSRFTVIRYEADLSRPTPEGTQNRIRLSKPNP